MTDKEYLLSQLAKEDEQLLGLNSLVWILLKNGQLQLNKQKTYMMHINKDK